ncbi:MAG: DUF4392 domain-containing protein [Armatimonadetes bacterium]|nr:DUF4392 domain-containing protein [Armatimonadota bacterium]
MPEIVGEYVDRLVTVTMKPKRRITKSGSTLSQRDHVHRLYDTAREKLGAPLTYLAARLLLDRVGPGETVFLVTGAGGPPVRPVGEVDGYLGAAAITRAMMFGRKANVVFVSDDWAWEPLLATCRGADLILKRPGEEYMAISATFETMPRDHEPCERRATELLDQYRPKAIVAVERLGPNHKEVTHNGTGISRDPTQGKTQYLFDQAAARGIATVGIGDGGNEIGFGLIVDAVREILPHGLRCQCPCQGGMACRVTTDVLVVAAISDWGGYGVAANIAFQLEKPGAMINADMLERMLRNCVEAGALDGQSALPELADDGVPLIAHRACVDILNTLITIAASEVDDPAH